MRKIKLFENFYGSDLHFVEKWEARRAYMACSLYNEPEEYKGASVTECEIHWSIDPDFSKNGLEISIRVSKINLTLEVEKEMDDPELDNEITEVELSLTPEFDQIDVELYKPPFYVNDLEISMNNSMDPEEWTYELTVGNDSRY